MRSCIPIIVLLCLITGCALFQAPIDADTAYRSAQYTRAAELYEEEYKMADDLVEKGRVAERIADCYRLSNKTAKAETWYAKALDFSTNLKIYYKYGLMQKTNEKYEEAIATFKDFAFNNPLDRAEAKKQIRACQLAIEWAEEVSNIEIVNLIDLNSPAADYAPVLYNLKGEQNALVFTSDRADASGDKTYGWTGRDFSDLFISRMEENKRWSSPQLFSDSLSTNYNEGTVTFTPDYTGVYFSRCGSNSIGDDFCKLFYSRKNVDGNWSEAERLILFDSDSINLSQPYLSPDGMDLYFTADAEDSYGDKDLYVCKRQSDGWGEPRNLGPEINTKDKEGYPYIHTDGRLYFASNGHMGMGGLDLFMAERIGKGWGNVTNLKAPINSPADDFALIFHEYLDPSLIDSIEAIGYFSSTRKGGRGDDDIYQLLHLIPQEEPIDTPVIAEVDSSKIIPKIFIEGEVFAKTINEDSGEESLSKLPYAIVEILGLNADSYLAERIVSDKNGYFKLEVEPKSEYKITASSNGYFTTSIVQKTPSVDKLEMDKTITVRLELDRIIAQKEVVVDNIYYDLDKADIREDARPILDEVALLLKDNPNLYIEFGSHTDSRGQNRYNLDLSQRRAQSVVDYLVSRGIDNRRLTPRGYGETQLVNGCADGVNCAEEQHQENRRTTFKVIGTNFRGQ